MHPPKVGASFSQSVHGHFTEKTPSFDRKIMKIESEKSRLDLSNQKNPTSCPEILETLKWF